MLPLSYRGRLPDPLKNSPRRPRFDLVKPFVYDIYDYIMPNFNKKIKETE